MTQWIFRRQECKCSSELVRVNERNVSENLSDASMVSLSKEPESEESFEGTLPFPANRYKPLRLIARTMNSTVYKCFDRRLGRIVAIKTLMFVEPDAVIRFQKEGKAAGSLTHPNIVEVLDLGVDEGGSAYMVLEFIEAVNLDDWLAKNGPLTEVETSSYIRGVCRALEFAHSKGIYHRDLNPKNILIVDNREVKLIDFGLALLADSEEGGTDTKGLSLAGTPLFMSPDQFNGRPYDVRSEIYSLGCVLFACVTGRPPYEGDSALAIARQHAEAPIPTLEAVLPDRAVSQNLRDVISRCLDKNPEHRYATVDDLANALNIELLDKNCEHSAGPNDYDEPGAKAGSGAIVKSPLNIKTVSLAVCAFTLIAGGAALVISRGNKKADEVRLSDKFPASSQIKGMKTANNADLDAKLDSDFSKFLDGDRRKLDHLNLHEADKVRENKSATNENLRAALETYESYIAMRTASGAVSGPDELLSRALIGAYDVNLRLEQFQKLGKLEKQITLVCPDDSKPPKFPESRNMADKAYQLFQKGSECFVKENKPSDAVNSLESASLMWDKIHAKDGLKNVILELNIGTTCLYFSNWQ
ncbi:MAG: serine/threonine protein kinase, partial [Cyanobacteria bacterium]|nr:serine/threonine protein kinase [Cyanobacteriota bacterium]